VTDAAVVVVNGRAVRVTALMLGLVQELLDAATDIDQVVVGEVRLRVRPGKVSCYVTRGRPPRKIQS